MESKTTLSLSRDHCLSQEGDDLEQNFKKSSLEQEFISGKNKIFIVRIFGKCKAPQENKVSLGFLLLLVLTLTPQGQVL